MRLIMLFTIVSLIMAFGSTSFLLGMELKPEKICQEPDVVTVYKEKQCPITLCAECDPCVTKVFNITLPTPVVCEEPNRYDFAIRGTGYLKFIDKPCSDGTKKRYYNNRTSG